MKLFGDVVAELTYDDDDYKLINHKDPIYEEIYNMWCGVHGLIPSEKMELEGKFSLAVIFPGTSMDITLNPEKYTQRWIVK